MAIDAKKARDVIKSVGDQPKKLLFGIDSVVDNLMMALFSRVAYDQDRGKYLGQAHVHLVSSPGKGKTGLLRYTASTIGGKYGFAAGHPMMETSEIIGYERENPVSKKPEQIRGPIFANVFLFTEINRTHPKGLAPLLQAMEERAVFLSKTDPESGLSEMEMCPLFPIAPGDERLFFWLIADSNPIEQEGTYPLPEALIDRFAVSFDVPYPSPEDEKKIRYKNLRGKNIEQVTDLSTVLEISELIVDAVKIGDNVDEYIERLMVNTRPGNEHRRWAGAELKGFVDQNVKLGLSPRVALSFEALVRTAAFIGGRESASIDDVQKVAPLVMTHRISLSYHAIGSYVEKSDIVRKVIEETEAP